MSKQRRMRLNRNKRTRSRRSFIRNGVEQLESRVFPGGFLDLLAGAAIAATFDLLPDEFSIPEEIEAESDAFATRDRSAKSSLQNAWSLPDIERESNENGVALRQSFDGLDITPVSRATTNLQVSASFVDAFFTSNQLATPSPRHPVTPSPQLSTSSPSSSSPISQLGSGVEAGSGQGYDIGGTALLQPSADNSSQSAPYFPAWMIGEGEAPTGPSGPSGPSGGSGPSAPTGTTSPSGPSSPSAPTGTTSPSGPTSPPTAHDGYVYTIHDQVTTGTFSGQDWDYDLLSISVSSSSLGSLSLSSPYQSPWDSSTTFADYTFTPNPGATGSETLTLTVSDGGYSDDASVSVSVWNSVPEPSDDWAYTIHDQDATGNVAWNDGLMQNGSNWQDYDSDTITFALVDDVSNGTLTLDSATGDFTYEPSTGFVGNDSFTYQLSDGLGTSTYIATVFIAVVNNVPEPTDDGPFMITCNCDPDEKTGNVADNDGLTADGDNWKDSDGDSVTFVLVDNVSNGTLTFDTASGEFKYVQNEGYLGDDSFTYKITDGLGTSTTKATVSLSVVGMIADATGDEVTGTFTVDGNATSSAEKGTFTPAGGVERETTDEELIYTKYYLKQYDGPTEFTVDYTVKLNADGTFKAAGSTVKMTTVNYTSRTYIVRDSLTQAQKDALIAAGKTIYEDPDNGKFYIFSTPTLTPSGWTTLSIPITSATLVDGKLHSFEFEGAWYGNPPAGLIDKGIEGEVDLKKCKAEFTAKYQDPIRGAIATFETSGKIKN